MVEADSWWPCPRCAKLPMATVLQRPESCPRAGLEPPVWIKGDELNQMDSAGETSLLILVVDDEPAMVGAVSALVGRAGHRVVTAYDGNSALRRFSEERPDLVLLDLAMPGLDGVEVCRTIRRMSQTPIIVLTGEADERAKVEALDMGADDYVVKPFGKQELLARIRAVMRRRGNDAEPRGVGELRWGSIVLDRGRHTAAVSGKKLVLTRTDYLSPIH